MSGVEKSIADSLELPERWFLDLGDYIIDLAWAPSGEQLAIATVEGRILLIDDGHRRGVAREVGNHAGGASSVAWRADGKEFASAGHDGVVRVWNAADGQIIRELPLGSDWATKVAYQPRRNLLAAAAGRSLKLWNPDGSLVYESADHESTIADLEWNPDGSAIAVAAYFGVTLHVPGRQTRPRKYEWKGSSLVLSWSPRSQFIATGEQDSTVHFWHVKSGKDAQMWGFETKVQELAWHRHGEHLATGGGDSIAIWDCSGKGPEGRQPKMLEGHPHRITQLAFQHAGDLLASSDRDGILLFWSPWENYRPLAGRVFEAGISRLAWSPCDSLVALGQESGVVTVLEATR